MPRAGRRGATTIAFNLLLLRREDKPDTHGVEHLRDRVRQAVPGARVHIARSDREAEPQIGAAEAAFGWVSPELLARAEKLRWIHCPQAGPDPAYYHEALVNSVVVVTNVRGVYNDHIGAHILSYVLAFARGLHIYLARQIRREWRTGAPTIHMPETTAVIVGVGGIGGETARLCAAFGMRVLAVDPRVETPPEGVAELYRPEVLREVVGRGDFVIATVPETPATEGLFNAELFRAMKPGGYFINIGRGATVILADLDRALRSGHLAGAALDVFQQEPLPAEHPLWDAPGMMSVCQN